MLQIDELLTPTALHQLRSLALESTTFYDTKNGYLGSYLDDGPSSPWLDMLARELQERMPRILKGQPLQQAWFYKYDSSASLRGIKVHADLASVNLNIWLAPETTNLSPGKGGLLIYDKLPRTNFNHETFESFNNWEKEGAMMDFLETSNDSLRSSLTPFLRNEHTSTSLRLASLCSS